MHSRDQTTARHRRCRRTAAHTLPAGVAVAVLAAVLTAAGLLLPGPDPDRVAPSAAVTADASTTSPGQEPAATSTRPALPASGAVVRAAAVLRAWDARRADAWAKGDVAALRELYVDGAGAADVRLLRRYGDRGLRVQALTMQLLAVEVLAHRPGRWHLRVTDRVVAGTLVDGRRRFRLPHDGAETRTIRLVREGREAWRVVEVRPVPG